jgi:hypothetical protein
VYKGRPSGAAAAIKAYKQGHAAPQLQQEQQQQQQLHSGGQDRSLASGSSSSSKQAPAAAAAVSAGRWGTERQGQGWGSAQQQPQLGGSSEVLIVPFEFKTGKDYFSHRAQVCARPCCPLACTRKSLQLLRRLQHSNAVRQGMQASSHVPA